MYMGIWGEHEGQSRAKNKKKYWNQKPICVFFKKYYLSKEKEIRNNIKLEEKEISV